jgi:ADP-ribose pyrophosphatase YjhB (NUDIX family)
MSEKNIFEEREKGFEEEYFLRKERELIEKLHQRQAHDAARRQMAEATGIKDEEVLAALQDLGYTPETVSLLHLAPFVQVAWAEGGVSDKERELIFEAAQSRGITPGTPAHAQLTAWLEQPPPAEFFENTLRAINIFLAALPAEQQTDTRQSLLNYCTQIAAASGGFLGFGSVSDEERMLIARIATELSQNRAAAVQQVLER